MSHLKIIPTIIFSVLLSFIFINCELFAGIILPPPPPAPMNNECSMAEGPLAIPSTTPGTTFAGTQTPSPPLPNGGLCGTSHTAADVWYTVTGTGNVMTASTCNDAAYDTKITIWCAECDNLICVAGNDDGPGCAGFTSEVMWDSTNGTEYTVMVHGFGTATGNFNLTITDTGILSSDPVDCGEMDPIGGCCFPDGSCVEVTADECSDSGGDYQGDDTSCIIDGDDDDEFLCEQPMGGCCMPDASCTELTETECEESGGTYQGNGTLCSDVDCPILICPGEGDCCESKESPGCEDCNCQETVCAIDSDCCDISWDSKCEDLAEEKCLKCNEQLTTDTDPLQLYSYFDLRDRESFVQVTNVVNSPATVHVQIFNVNDNCNENNFFDNYTGNDTHVYNLSDITTNDGNPSGIVLPPNAYGFVVTTVVEGVGGPTSDESVIVGNFRILDNAGYEYRTNSSGIRDIEPIDISEFTFNYNIKGDIMLSDVVGINVNQETSSGEVDVSPLNSYSVFDIDIYNLDEVPFSCRDITFACIDEDNPLLGQLLENTGVSVASFDYGINDALPHSRGGELLCLSNDIADGIVVLKPESSSSDVFTGYVGLNSGNGRGSMDSFWSENFFISVGTPQPEG